MIRSGQKCDSKLSGIVLFSDIPGGYFQPKIESYLIASHTISDSTWKYSPVIRRQKKCFMLFYVMTRQKSVLNLVTKYNHCSNFCHSDHGIQFPRLIYKMVLYLLSIIDSKLAWTPYVRSYVAALSKLFFCASNNQNNNISLFGKIIKIVLSRVKLVSRMSLNLNKVHPPFK